jgi:hypothetical protein
LVISNKALARIVGTLLGRSEALTIYAHIEHCSQSMRFASSMEKVHGLTCTKIGRLVATSPF